MLFRILHDYQRHISCLLLLEAPQNHSCSSLLWFNQCDTVLDRYRAERSGTRCKDQYSNDLLTLRIEVRLLIAASRGFFFLFFFFFFFYSLSLSLPLPLPLSPSLVLILIVALPITIALTQRKKINPSANRVIKMLLSDLSLFGFPQLTKKR